MRAWWLRVGPWLREFLRRALAVQLRTLGPRLCSRGLDRHTCGPTDHHVNREPRRRCQTPPSCSRKQSPAASSASRCGGRCSRVPVGEPATHRSASRTHSAFLHTHGPLFRVRVGVGPRLDPVPAMRLAYAGTPGLALISGGRARRLVAPFGVTYLCEGAGFHATICVRTNYGSCDPSVGA